MSVHLILAIFSPLDIALSLSFSFFTLMQSVEATAGFPWYVNPYQPSARFLSLKYSPVLDTHITWLKLASNITFKSYWNSADR